jgi:CDGSH-type Zn-finger protein
MSDAKIAQKSPYAVELDAGTYYWCSCGRSSNQPFCDGSHQGSTFEPVPFTVDERKTLYLCGCKQTTDAPFCDGSHNQL